MHKKRTGSNSRADTDSSHTNEQTNNGQKQNCLSNNNSRDMKQRDNGRTQENNNELDQSAISQDIQDKNSSVFKNIISKDKLKGWYSRLGRKNTTVRHDSDLQDPQMQLVDQPSMTSSKTSEFRRFFKKRGGPSANVLNTSQPAAELNELKSEFKSEQGPIRSDHINEIDTPCDFELVSMKGTRPPRALRHYQQAHSREMIKKMFLLSDFEVFISLMKFMIGVGIFIRPKMMWEAGLFNAVTSELIALAAVLISNSNLIRCLNYMPSQLTKPDANLTYGAVVHFIMDAREERIDRIYRKVGLRNHKPKPGKAGRFFQDTLDFQIVTSCLCLCISYNKYIIDQLLQIMAQNEVTWQFEWLGVQYQNQEIISISTAMVVFLLLFVNLKQMSFVARLVMLVTIFVIGWVSFDAFMKFYVTWQLQSEHHYLVDPTGSHKAAQAAQAATAIGNATINATLSNLTQTTNETAGDAIQQNNTHGSLVQMTLRSIPDKTVQHYQQPKSFIPFTDFGPKIPVFMPFIPNFMDYFSQASGVYEGIPMLPALYSNARNPLNFQKNVMIVMTTICMFIILFAPLCMLAYGKDLRDVVLLNLPYGTYETMVQASYSLCLIYNIAINLFPIMNIFNSLQQRYNPKRTSSRGRERMNQVPAKRSYFSHICQFFVGIITWNQVVFRLLLTIGVMYISINVQSLQLPFMINSAICSNYFQIILPNIMILRLTAEVEELWENINKNKKQPILGVTPPPMKKLSSVKWSGSRDIYGRSDSRDKFGRSDSHGRRSQRSSRMSSDGEFNNNFLDRSYEVGGKRRTRGGTNMSIIQELRSQPMHTMQTGQEKTIMNNLRINKNRNAILAYVLILYGIICLGWGTQSIYVILRDDYKMF